MISLKPLRIVSYSVWPVVGVAAILARCINARTSHSCRCLWRFSGYGNGTHFDEDINWTESPIEAEAVLREADLVIIHNGEIEQRHLPLLTGKAIITMAHNIMNPVEHDFVKQGFPGIVVGQSWATLPEFQGWLAVPNPIPLWEEPFQPGEKGECVTICYTPAVKHDYYPSDHPYYLYSKGYESTMRILDKLAAQFSLHLEVIRDHQLPHAQVLEQKRRAHIVIDECVTGSYHRNSLEGLAAGCVVVNGVGMSPGVIDTLRYCAGGEPSNPFVFASLEVLEGVLTSLIQRGPDSLAEEGKQNRLWMEQHWDFAWQWERFWLPVINKAMNAS